MHILLAVAGSHCLKVESEKAIIVCIIEMTMGNEKK